MTCLKHQCIASPAPSQRKLDQTIQAEESFRVGEVKVKSRVKCGSIAHYQLCHCL